jgi:hypothetical protein
MGGFRLRMVQITPTMRSPQRTRGLIKIPRWLEEHDGRPAVGNSGIPQRRFRGLVRFLQTYAAGLPADHPAKPSETPVALFLRYAADDLKAFMLEACLQQRPQDRDNALHEWFCPIRPSDRFSCASLKS